MLGWEAGGVKLWTSYFRGQRWEKKLLPSWDPGLVARGLDRLPLSTLYGKLPLVFGRKVPKEEMKRDLTPAKSPGN